MSSLELKPQEIPFDSRRSNCMFRPSPTKPFVATRLAIEMHGQDILFGLNYLQTLAAARNGLDYLQVFTVEGRPEPLWFIEDGDGGAITALLPSEY